MREEDLYSNAIKNVGPVYEMINEDTVGEVKNCVSSTGVAKQKYIDASDDVMPQDYQLYIAEDALDCMNSLEVGDVFFPWKKASFNDRIMYRLGLFSKY